DAYSVAGALRDQPDVIFIQRSRGYASRPALTIAHIAALIAQSRNDAPGAVIVVDNCYGEFVEGREPSDVGADVVIGSLIKNPGAGIAPGGAYIAGRTDLVERIADAVFAPGLGRKVGASYDSLRWLFAGLQRAPQGVAQSLKILDFAAALFGRLGFAVQPEPGAERGDIIQAIRLGSAETLDAFCEGLQALMPVHPHAKPVAGPVPGYHDPVLMAGGPFINGSTMELSCDAPLRDPYAVYLQGGLDVAHGVLACMNAATAVVSRGRHSGTARE
ncbi:MAG: methionine gamma-lyase family protein, partial [Candidatus Eremiobacteraeota bacterium]|nr:methionine gamma-lyase family protein [Candidatus Eremiobacteraeota bacterium]